MYKEFRNTCDEYLEAFQNANDGHTEPIPKEVNDLMDKFMQNHVNMSVSEEYETDPSCLGLLRALKAQIQAQWGHDR